MPDDLCPELAVSRPTEPFRRPTALGIRCERHGHPQTVAPPCQKRVPFLGGKNQLASWFRASRDVPEKKRSVIELDIRDRLRRTCHERCKRLFINSRLARRYCFLCENLWDVSRILGVVITPVADACDVLQQFEIAI